MGVPDKVLCLGKLFRLSVPSLALECLWAGANSTAVLGASSHLGSGCNVRGVRFVQTQVGWRVCTSEQGFEITFIL